MKEPLFGSIGLFEDKFVYASYAFAAGLPPGAPAMGLVWTLVPADCVPCTALQTEAGYSVSFPGSPWWQWLPPPPPPKRASTAGECICPALSTFPPAYLLLF